MEAGATLLPRRPPLALEPFNLSFIDFWKTINMVFMEVKMPWNSIISPQLLDAKGTILHKAIILRHMDDIAIRKASEEQLLA
ncbi:unnamed protein product [Musa acuminata subsp. malaccensis]|uniref:(wild Malaysian banana) hypothetical protein n=1 Tax=Musa acuminata subsp. malaccensis TaxID=214687 RepID=A0A804ILT9_MUSAM|nr:unnamed protein product [Musa acuminata subsp. malaccensis]